MSYRFYISPENIILKENSANLTGDDWHHAANVLRHKIGDRLEFFDGHGRTYKAVISGVDKNKFSLKITETSMHDLEYGLSIFVGLPKGSKMDIICKALTEAGATTIGFFSSKFTQVKLSKDKKWKRATKIIIESSKQSGRSWLPEIVFLQNIEHLIEKLEKSGGKNILFYEKAQNYLPLSLLKGKDVNVIVGSEGGFAEEEVSKMKDAQFNISRLNKHILRVETAALAAT